MRRLQALLGLACLLACRASAPTTPPGPPREPAALIVGSTVLTMRDATPHPDHTIVVRNETIVAVEPAAKWTPTPADTVIDAAGKFTIPGLADMHVHNWSEHEHAIYVAYGLTTVRNMFGSPMHLQWRDEIAKGERLGPRLVTTGPIIDGPPGIWPMSAVVGDAEQAREVVRFHIEAGYDQIKLYSLLRAEVFEAAVLEARKAGVTPTGHVPGRVPLADALALDYGSIEHLTGYIEALQAPQSPQRTDPATFYGQPFAQQLEVLSQHADMTRAAELAALTKNHDQWNTPTLVVARNVMATTPEAREVLGKDPRMRYVPKTMSDTWQKRVSADVELDGLFDQYVAIVGALHEAGCDLMVGSDTPNPFTFPGSSAHEELGLLVDAGLSPFEALAAATVQPARYLGEEGAFGVLAEGARADVLVLDADPLADIRNTATIAGVMLRGRWLPRGELDRLLDEAAAGIAGLTAP